MLSRPAPTKRRVVFCCIAGSFPAPSAPRLFRVEIPGRAMRGARTSWHLTSDIGAGGQTADTAKPTLVTLNRRGPCHFAVLHNAADRVLLS